MGLLKEISEYKGYNYGIRTAEQMAKLSGCCPQVAQLGIAGDPVTLERFLKSRPETVVAAPQMVMMGYDVAGDFVDIGAYMSGDPECMVSYDNSKEDARTLEVQICMGRPWFCPDEKVFAYYSNVLHVIDQLEAKGVRCQILVHYRAVSLESKRTLYMGMGLKRESDPLNMALFAGIVLNNDYFTYAFCDPRPDREPIIDESVAIDCIATEFEQREDSIQFPSMYYLKNYERDEFPLDTFLKECGLSHLID